jgi:flagellar motor switch protein FliN/FliY
MPTSPHAILQLKVPLIVSIAARRAAVDEVLALGPGAILELSKSADEPLDVLVNNKHIATGTAVKVGEKFGIRVNAIGSPRDRAEALAADTDAEA